MYRFAVLGNPIKQSQSPWVHGEFAKQCGLNVDYQKILVPLDHFVQEVQALQVRGLHGINITVPFKVEAYELADEVSAQGRAAGAVNTFKFQDGRILADNTDGVGLITDISQNLGFSLKMKRVLLLGAGGAARGILLPLLDAGPSEIVLLNRSHDKALKIWEDFQRPAALCVEKIAHLKNECFDVVLDATSTKDVLPILPEGLRLAPNSLCYDLKYGPHPSAFLRWAYDFKAALVVDGLGMLIEQAARAFHWWTNHVPSTQNVIQLARQKLNSPDHHHN